MTAGHKLAAKRREAKRRDAARAKAIHPKEEKALRARALDNVLDDLEMLIRSARIRIDGKAGPRTRMLATEEHVLLQYAVFAVNEQASV